MLHKNRLYITLFITILVILTTIGIVSAAEQVSLTVSHSLIMTYSQIERVAVANPDIADVTLASADEVLLVGKGAGQTTLHIWAGGKRLSFEVTVTAEDGAAAAEIARLIGLPGVTVTKIGKNVTLEGIVSSQQDKQRAEKIAGLYSEKVINLLEAAKPVQVKIEAVILEINREKAKDLGIKWGTDAVSSPGNFTFGQGAANSYIQSGVLGGLNTYNPINGQLSALVKNGTAKILSQPNIITLSGEKAHIMIGGQIPVPATYQNGQITIEWKEYGIKLEIAPDVGRDGLINSKVKAEVSSLDWNSTHKIQLGTNVYIPPLKVNKAEASLALASGQTMAVGGLIYSLTSKDVTKVPLLAELPLLGQLFTSTSYSRGETELIILITPTIIDPAAYVPRATPEMKSFILESPLGGIGNGEKN